MLSTRGGSAPETFVECYYGWTSNTNIYPEENWNAECSSGEPNGDGDGCMNIACGGDNVGCFKADYGIAKLIV